MWTPILKKLATLREMQDGTYNLDDLADMLEAIAYEQAVEARVIERSRSKRDGKNI